MYVSTINVNKYCVSSFADDAEIEASVKNTKRRLVEAEKKISGKPT